ncbi:ADE_G0012570.mRNA.1.CDS.1 [Saccharomyces cerevisiae]|nr:Gpi17p [Saccharomyces cerevisiae YJM1399]CAI4374778.1 ADE_G0012570.mRNA.1.CDS.1 [Saccharomyces cerevisiae]CAI6581749.1 ADE_G0012570.mRNA.1.CDS.1 [Saccharomyces cerevisiae]
MSNANLRKWVGFCFVAIYLFLGVPLWYKLTTVYRASLPINYIESLQNNKFQDIHLVIPVYVKSDTYRFPDVHDAIQVQVNHLLNSQEQQVPWSLQVLPYNETIEQMESEGNQFHVVTLKLDEFIGYSSAYDTKETLVYYDDAAVLSNDLPFFVAQTLVEHTFQLEWTHLNKTCEGVSTNNDVAISYDPNIHLSVTLLSGDGNPVAWEIEPTLTDYFSPFRKFLSPLVNFTVDSSIVYHNDLNLHSLNGSCTSVTWFDLSHTIDLSELSSMTYYPEDSALNLAIVFPSASSSPDGLAFINGTRISDEITTLDWNSYLVPRWGVIIINKMPLKPNSVISEDYLEPMMYRFATDIFQLLGLTEGSQDLLSPYITIDSFKRLTILQNLDKATETLWSLVKLTQQFQGMSIPREVSDNVIEALDLRLQIIDLLNDPGKGGDIVWNNALHLSNELVKLCEKAFFNGEMVQQNFFPQEHMIAVYLPLLGPISAVMFFGFYNVMKEKNQKSKKNGTEREVAKEKLELKEAQKLHAIDGEDEL